MDAVKDKMEKLAEHIRVNGYPTWHRDERMSYRLDDEYFTYDLFDDNNGVSILIGGIERSDETKVPLWKAMFEDRKFKRFMPKIMVVRKKK